MKKELELLNEEIELLNKKKEILEKEAQKIKDNIDVERACGKIILTDGYLNIKGGFIQKQNTAKYKTKQSGRYFVIDFGEATGNELDIEVTGHDKIARVYFTDEV